MALHLRTLDDNPPRSYAGYEVTTGTNGDFHFPLIKPGHYQLESFVPFEYGALSPGTRGTPINVWLATTAAPALAKRLEPFGSDGTVSKLTSSVDEVATTENIPMSGILEEGTYS